MNSAPPLPERRDLCWSIDSPGNQFSEKIYAALPDRRSMQIQGHHGDIFLRITLLPPKYNVVHLPKSLEMVKTTFLKITHSSGDQNAEK
ncbi:hypothetical protein J6590_038640 [Homalodisca vitripennis]|nr:hypothetical protein J6590_038640 [Homalodisca vitripennis]